MRILLLFLILASSCLADNWAVVVAGSNTWYNYRHQADACHAYQILHENQIPDSNIIVMMYDDIAYNPENPVPGVILNNPNGANVYDGVPKDYTGNDVNPTNFMAVLTGNSSGATGRVLETGPDDNIFIYFTDHGGPGLICFPNDVLYAHQLISTLEYMYNNNKYKSLVFYLEACESGSMFNGLLNSSWNIYATTAATPTESSWGCYYDAFLNNYLGDVYSVNWLQNSDSFINDWDETLSNQYQIVKNETTTSTVCHYGNNSMSSLLLKDFLIFQNVSSHLTKRRKHEHHDSPKDKIEVYDIPIDLMMRKYIQTHSPNLKKLILQQIQNEFVNRWTYDLIFQDAYNQLTETADVGVCHQNNFIDTHCLEELVTFHESIFGKFTDYGRKYLQVYAQACKVSQNKI
jgi:legumain